MSKLDDVIRELKIALKKDNENLRKEVEKIIKKYGKKKRSKKGAFEIKTGYAYYINEKKPIYAKKILKQILDRNIPGLYLTRTNPLELEFQNYENAKVYWLSSMKGKDKINPGDLTKIQSIVVDFIKSNERGVVVLEGIETMITNTSFLKVLHLIQRLRDIISEMRGILIVSIDLETLSPKDVALFKKEIINEIPVKNN